MPQPPIIRHLNIDLSKGFPRHWLGGDGFRSQLFNAFSMTFPIGEQYFIDCISAALPHLSDPALRDEVKGFIGQEATHRHLHTLCNEHLFKQGLHYLSEPLVKWRAKRSERFSIQSRMAITMAYEHFTAVFADGVLSNPSWLEDAAEPLKTLWTWHCVEETEHKSVAFDVYVALGGGYGRRIAWYAYVVLGFAIDSAVQITNNLYRDGQLFKPRTWVSAMRVFFGRKGMIWHMAPQILKYVLPGFTPWHRDNQALATKWLQEQSNSYREVKRPT